MVRITPTSGMYTDGRRNARRHTCIEINHQFYPTVAQARRDAMTVGQLLRSLKSDSRPKDSNPTVLVLTGVVNGKALYRPLARISTGRISATGRPELQSRGGIQAALLGVD